MYNMYSGKHKLYKVLSIMMWLPKSVLVLLVSLQLLTSAANTTEAATNMQTVCRMNSTSPARAHQATLAMAMTAPPSTDAQTTMVAAVILQHVCSRGRWVTWSRHFYLKLE